MEQLVGDLRFSLRSLRKNPAFTIAALAVLALGIGAVVAIASVMTAALVQGMPYGEPERITLLQSALRFDARVQPMPVSVPDFGDWQAKSHSFEAMALYSNPQNLNLLLDGEPRHVSGEFVSARYFAVLGLEPTLGRAFTAEETEQAGEHRVVMLSHALWASLFGGAKEVAGQEVTLNGARYQVVGVAPAGFRGLTDGAELWLPLGAAALIENPAMLQERRIRWLLAAARLQPGMSAAQAQADLDGVAQDLAAEYPDTNRIVGVEVTPLFRAWYGELSSSLRLLLGGAGFVLLIACINVLSLLLARALARRREMALRSSLGASRGQLIRQLLAESLVLSFGGAILGFVLAQWGSSALLASGGTGLKSFVAVRPSLAVAGVSVLVALVSAVVFGLLPAWLLSRVRLTEVLQEGSKGSAAGFGRGRAQTALVVAQVGLALALLIGTGLMVRGFTKLRTRELGFEPRNLATIRLNPKGEQYSSEASRFELVRAGLARLSALPGVAAVAAAGPSIPTERGAVADFALEEHSDPASENKFLFSVHHVSPAYFSTLEIPILEGREFDSGDHPQGQRVAIVSEALAKRLFAGRSPLGQGIRFFRGPQDAWMRVVGVAKDVGHQGLTPDPLQAPAIYFPVLQQLPRGVAVVNFLVRGARGSEVASLLPALRRELAAVAPTLPAYDPRTMDQRLDEQAAPARFLVLLMGAFAAAALVLATLGLYGVVSYAVARLRKEIGIRLALGAQRKTVLAMVLGRALAIAGLGVAVGLAAALALTRLLESRLYGVSATEPLTFVLAIGLLFATVLVASLVPALSASGTPPTEALKGD